MNIREMPLVRHVGNTITVYEDGYSEYAFEAYERMTDGGCRARMDPNGDLTWAVGGDAVLHMKHVRDEYPTVRLPQL